MCKRSEWFLFFFLGLLLMTNCSAPASGTPVQSPFQVTSSLTSTPVERVTVKSTPSPDRTPALPGTIVTLPPAIQDWTAYEFPELGTGLTLPSSWEVVRMPGFYAAGPDSEMGLLASEVVVGFRDNVPLEVPALAETMVQTWKDLHASDFYTTSIRVGGVAGVAFWRLPNTCLTVYAPAYGLVHEITLMPYFCEPGSRQIHPIGQVILGSISFFPVTESP